MDDLDETNGPLVLDNGSAFCKAGFAGDDLPKAEFRSVVGRPRHQIRLPELHRREQYIGEEAQSNRGVLALHYPIQRGVVTNWDTMEAVWDHTFTTELRVAPSEHPVLLTEPSLNPKANREKMAQVMFETFKVPALYVAFQSVLSFFAAGRSAGVVLESGDGVTQTVAIYQGHCLAHATRRQNFAGQDVTDYLGECLKERGGSLPTAAAEREIVRKIKEAHCCVAADSPQDLSGDPSSLQREYELPDGQLISIGSERFRAPEVLFYPNLAGLGLEGIHEMVYNTVQSCDIDVRRDLLSNIILSGGTSMLPGVRDRLKTEVISLAPARATVRVVSYPQKLHHAAWIGGSILASLSMFNQISFSKQDYDEAGPSIIHRTKSYL